MSENTDHDLPEDVLPQEVVAKLKDVSATQIDVPASVDEQILADARSVFAAARPASRRFAARKWAGIAAVGSLAAALVVAAIGPWGGGDETPLIASNTPAASEMHDMAGDSAALESASAEGPMTKQMLVSSIRDVDRDGRVDILDAFALARQVQSSPTDAQGDQNGDGVVNNDDIQLVARMAVTL